MKGDTRLKMRAAGFSLIELMIAVVIMGILAAVALPTYRDYIRKGHRADAQGHLMDLAQQEQRYFLDARSYASTVAGLGTTTPTSVSEYYTIGITLAASPPSFSISAVPKSTQAADSCGTLTITSAGVKSSSAGTNCW